MAGEKIRIGKDVRLRWKIKVNEQIQDLSQYHLRLEIKYPSGIRKNLPFHVEYDTVIADFLGMEHKVLGQHLLTLWRNFGSIGQTAVDQVDAFTLVATTDEESQGVGNNLSTVTVNMSGSMAIGVQGLSAYEIWLNNGHHGTEQDFVAWIRQPALDAAANSNKLNEQITAAEAAREAAFVTAKKEMQDVTVNASVTITQAMNLSNMLEKNEQARTKAESDRVATFAVMQSDNQKSIQAANDAAAKATTESDLANTAARNANNAKTTADTAAGNANEAADTARRAAAQVDTAVSNANTALQDANNATTRVEAVVADANKAVSDARTAVGEANKANTNANAAIGKANEAKTSAEVAAQKANEASANATKEAARAKEIADHPQIIGVNGNWHKWDEARNEYVDSGQIARGGAMFPVPHIQNNRLVFIDSSTGLTDRIQRKGNRLIFKL